MRLDEVRDEVTADYREKKSVATSLFVCFADLRVVIYWCRLLVTL